MSETILIVEDEENLNRMVADYFSALGYETRSAADGAQALRLVREAPPDLVLLDVMLPGIDGHDVIRRLRHERDVPVIFLTARSEEADKLIGLELGADDYVVKPFSLKELAARVRAVLRRSGRSGGSASEETTGGRAGEGLHGEPEKNTLEHGDLTIDLERRIALRSGEPVNLTAAQFEILSLFLEHPGRVFTRAEILQRISGTAFEGYERTIDVHIKNVRKAVEQDPSNPQYILTVWGVGYKLAEERKDRPL